MPEQAVPGWLVDAVAQFGRDARATLASGKGQDEDALRTPLVNLVKAVGDRLGIRKVVPVGEVRLEELEVRPDYAIEVDGAVCGYIEIKKPGLGADAPALTGKHNVRQWKRLSDLPNLIYTDGTSWARYSHGERDGDIAVLGGDVRSSTGELTVPDGELLRLLSTFLRWEPAPIRSVGALVRSVAPLCRLLRDEVVDQLGRERTRIAQGQPASSQPFTGLAADWRTLLFPGASDREFADGYAQTVTFALLLARSRGVVMGRRSIHTVGDALGASSALMGRALQLLTDHVEPSFRVSLGTLLRVVSAIDWDKVRGGRRDTYLYLYEEFLEVYDDDLRKSSGSYYTPVDVAEQMVRLTDDVVRTRLQRPEGLGAPGVSVIDPAAGTGTFLLRILEIVHDRLAGDDGPGAAREAVADLATRLFGFELQMGPHAVSELRVNDVLTRLQVQVPPGGGVGLHVTNTLDDPEQDIIPASSATIPISESARRAREIKAAVPVTVVIGNPPYRERAIDDGGWVAHGHGPKSVNLMDDFRAAGNGRLEYVLHNLAWYFWRWGTWKVFDQHDGSDQHGIVAFITTAAYLRGPGFAGMRRYLRRSCDDGWIVDLTPEGMQPDVPTRIFPGVQQTLAIGIFLRRSPDTPSSEPARIRYRAVHGRRAEKFAALGEIGIDDHGWADTRTSPDTAPFTPAHALGWDDYPALTELFPVTVPGIKANRAWVYSPHSQTLSDRWAVLTATSDIDERRRLFKESRDRKIDTIVRGLPGFADPRTTIAKDSDPVVHPVPVLFRSFDRQFTLPDNRVFHGPSPNLWAASHTPGQLFLVEQHAEQITSGPGVIASTLMPDMHCFNNRGGRVLPTRHLSDASIVPQQLRSSLATALGVDTIDGDDLVAYVAAVVAHSGYTARFAEQLETPGVRVPVTTDLALWQEAVELGRRVLWLHTYGERHVEPAEGRPAGGVADAAAEKVKNLDGVPATVEGMPSTISHSSDLKSRHAEGDGENTLYLDGARFAPVPAAVWRYDVGGRPVVKSWFDYRRREPAGRRSSPLDDVNATTWAKADSDELTRLLGVLGGLVELEPRQAELLDAVRAGPLLSLEQLGDAGALPTPFDRKLR